MLSLSYKAAWFMCHRIRYAMEQPPMREKRYGVIEADETSWLNQVEMWFSKIERDVISRGVFTSIPDLRRKLMTYITRYNDQPRPIRWRYLDLTRHITGPKRSFTRH